MDETRIDTLTIEIGASSDKAVQEIEKVKTALQGVSKATSAGSKTNPLSEDMREIISNATKLDVAKVKLGQFRTALDAAFETGNADRAYDIRGKILQAEDSIAKLSAAVQTSITPLSEERQVMIASASDADVLRMKIAALGRAMNEAFAVGDERKALSLKAQINHAADALARLNAETEKTITPLSEQEQQMISTAKGADLLRLKLDSLKEAQQQAFAVGDSSKAIGLQSQINNVEDSIAKLEAAAQKTITPLSEQERQFISNASNADLLRAKIADLNAAMQQAFAAGDAGKARGIKWQINQAEESLSRLEEAARRTVTPLSEQEQQFISNATEADILRAKLESLNAAMQRAFDVGDRDKGYALRSQILSVQKQLDKLTASSDNASASIKRIGDTAKKSFAPIKRLFSSIVRVAFYRLIRSALRSIAEAFSEGAKNAYFFSKEAGDALGISSKLDQMASAFAKMKNQLGALAAQILVTIAPALIRLAEIITTAADKLSQFIAALRGETTYLKAKDITKEWAEQTEKGAKAAKEWKNQLLGFDEINRLNDSSATDGLTDFLEMFEIAEVEDTPFNKFAQMLHDWGVAALMAGGYIAVGLGIALLLLGHPLLGVSLIALGAAGIIKAAKSTDINAEMKNKLAQIAMIGGLALGGLGIVLLFTGHPLLGAAMIAAGFASMKYALDMSDLSQETSEKLLKIAGIAGGAMVGLGIVLLFFKPLLGIALIVAGAAALGWTMATTNDKIGEETREKLALIGMMAGYAMIGLGACLLMVNPGLGLALIIAGAAMVGISEEHVNWDKLASDVNAGLAKIGDVFVGWYDWLAMNIFQPIADWFASLVPDTSTWDTVGEALGGSAFANGGFPTEGELFIANEAGPELVGRIGNRNAVANSDQIVEGIASGVYNAVIAAMGQNNGGSEVNVYIGNERIYSGYNAYQRRMALAEGV